MGNVRSLSQNREGVAEFLEEAADKFRKGEYHWLAGVFMDNDDYVVKFKGGMVESDFHAVVGGIEELKTWCLLEDGD